MQEKNNNLSKPKKDTLFWIAIVSMFIFTIMSMGTDIDQYSQRKDLNIPDWYFYIVMVVNGAILLSVFLMYCMKKMGIFLFPIAVLVHFITHIYYLSTMLYTDVTSLFLFVSVGLLYFIPVWKQLK